MDSLQIGLQLTVAGMGIVFFLLAVMAVLIAFLSRWDRAPVETPPAAAPARAFPPGLDADALAAITIAVRAHRITLRQQAAPAMRKHQPGTLPSRWVGIGRTRQTSSWRSLRRG
ncbi:MAG: sodium pump decarboxylase subunit gamma [Chloroflexi bacterium]|nr:sodium pump decarboxylase subunit gamma [Chloroflexota bacterium]